MLLANCIATSTTAVVVLAKLDFFYASIFFSNFCLEKLFFASLEYDGEKCINKNILNDKDRPSLVCI